MNGQVGIITGIWQQDFLFWKRPTYLCTFIGNVGLAMKPSEVEAFDHGRTLEELQIKLDGLSVADQLRVIGGPLP